MKFKLNCLLSALVLVYSGCGKQAPRPSEIINAARRNVSPRGVDLAGLKFYQTHEEIQSLLSPLRCQTKGNNIDVCTWKTSEGDRKKGFKGIDQIKLTFYKDFLQTIEVEYFQMFDAEYAEFDRSVREKYGYAIAGRLIDSTGTEWQYDSLKVILIPHKKLHWTGSMFVFNPVLEFQERALYGLWLNEVEQRKPETVY